jgi:phenylacetate-CoA ligase
MLPIDHFPLITDAGYHLLRRLQEHPHAPRYTHRGYNRMTREGLRRAQEFAAKLRDSPPNWQPGELPKWLAEFVEACYRDAPFYRQNGPAPDRFFDIPTASRADLNREPWSFVPDSQPLDGLVIYNTSGTTGHPLDILTHADTLALYVPLLRAALAAHSLTLDGGPGRVAIVLVCFQKRTYTYAAVSAALDQAGFVKVNLNPDEWRDPADRVRFLNECDPEIYTGDPLAFQQLAALPGLRARPKALVSTAMALAPGLAQALEGHFGCPALDVYSTNESGPIGVRVGEGYQLLQPRLYVEILDAAGDPCPPGERGEITLSGGFNPFLPLLRYRTGDYAALEFRGVPGRHMGLPLLVGLEGRPPVVFRAADGRPINNVDVSIALRPFPIAQYTLHQFADGRLQMKVRGAGLAVGQLRAALVELFGADQGLTIEEVNTLDMPGGKVVQYTSDLSPS